MVLSSEARVNDLAVDVLELHRIDRAQAEQRAELKATCNHLTGAVGDLSHQLRAEQ